MDYYILVHILRGKAKEYIDIITNQNNINLTPGEITSNLAIYHTLNEVADAITDTMKRS